MTYDKGMDTPEVLDAAADEVSKPGGWQQGDFGSYYEPEGAVCAAGAIQRVIVTPLLVEYGTTHLYDLPESVTSEINRQYVAALDSVYMLAGGSIPAWNDEPGRTAGEVADALRTAAKGLRDAPSPRRVER